MKNGRHIYFPLLHLLFFFKANWMTAVKEDRPKISNPGARLCTAHCLCPLAPIADPRRSAKEQLVVQTQRKSSRIRLGEDRPWSSWSTHWNKFCLKFHETSYTFCSNAHVLVTLVLFCKSVERPSAEITAGILTPCNYEQCHWWLSIQGVLLKYVSSSSLACTYSCLAQTTGLGFRGGFLGATIGCLQHGTNALEEAICLLKISLIQRLDERNLFILDDKIKIQKLSDLDRITQEICANQSLIPVFLSIPVKLSILY